MKPPTVLQIFVTVLASSLTAAMQRVFTPEELPNPEDSGKEILIPGTLRITTPTYTEKNCDLARSAACATCLNIKLCVSSTTQANNPTTRCPDRLPFCRMTVTGAVCQDTPDPAEAACAQPKTSFPCSGVGLYPDPLSCQVYHNCADQGAVAQDFDCPDGYKFSSKANGCTPQTVTCPAVNCTGESYFRVLLPYPDDPMYYLYCNKDFTNIPTKTNYFMFSCGQGATFNPNTELCEFKCPKEGNFVNTANPRQYHQCYLKNGKLVYTDKVCMASQKFSMADNSCV